MQRSASGIVAGVGRTLIAVVGASHAVVAGSEGDAFHS